ncbi:DoxX family protein [Nocardioides mangrovicus]|uniref:DoxX family protein n=1 Tax=Nocardioides mangrovicus TaxID=2478913 RepID=A0A3L8P3Q2_9ACTN|nr:DoxX family protein [Nocardioides mangrovicus]RLV49744.1 DoxX family protein [Nocardioides mangrovicus]
MPLTAHVLSALLAVAMLASGSLKIARTERIVRLMAAVGVGGRGLVVLGSLQLLATTGLFAGLWFTPFGIAAATGLVLYFAGAVGAHVRAHDPEWQGAAAFLVLSVVTLVVLLLSL